jgi:hypothetical protein
MESNLRSRVGFQKDEALEHVDVVEDRALGVVEADPDARLDSFLRLASFSASGFLLEVGMMDCKIVSSVNRGRDERGDCDE